MRTSIANSLEVRSPFLDMKMINSIGKTNPGSMTGIFDTKKELKKILISEGVKNFREIIGHKSK